MIICVKTFKHSSIQPRLWSPRRWVSNFDIFCFAKGGKPRKAGNIREFDSGHEKVRESGKSQGKKVATFVHQSLSGISPPYLADDCRLVANARERRLRSTASRTCVVTRTYSTFGDRAFGAAGPGLWNSLPLHLKDADISYSEYRRLLKTFLFGQWGHGAVWTVLTAPLRNIRTYLLTYYSFPVPWRVGSWVDLSTP